MARSPGDESQAMTAELTRDSALSTQHSALLQVQGLRKAFGGLQALDGVDLLVGEREIVGLIGPNGSGKTTFFNVLTGYYRPDGGSVRLAGREIAGCRPVDACRHGIA